MKLNDKPCKTCSRKGCGAYHDKCKPYQDAIALDKEMQRQREAERNLNSQMIDHKTKLMRKVYHGRRK